MVLVLDLGNTPRVLSSLDDTAIAGLDVLLGSDDSERHGGHQAAGMLSGGLVVLLNRWLVDLDALGLNDSSDALLEGGQVSRAESISLGNHWNQVDARAESLHNLDVERLQSVTGGADEVQASVDTEVDLVISAGLLLLQHVGLVLVVKELDDWHPGVAVVDIVAEARGVDDGQADLEELLLQLSLCDLDLDGLVDLLLVSPLVIGIVLDGRGEQGVDEGGLSEARFAGNHNSEGGTPLSNNLVSLVGQVCDTYGAGAAFGRHLDG